MAKTILVFEKNNKDYEKDNIKYYGYDVQYEDGTSVGMGLEKLCSAGLRTIIGKKTATRTKVELSTHFVENKETSLTKLATGERGRRLYAKKETETTARLFFHNDNPTEVIFDLKKDDPKYLELFGIIGLEPDKKLWFDLISTTVKDDDDQNEKTTG